MCLGSSDPFYVVSYYINWVTTSWTYSTVETSLVSIAHNNAHETIPCRVDLPSHVPTAGENLIVVEEPAAAEIAGVAGQLARHAHRSVTVLQTEIMVRV